MAVSRLALKQNELLRLELRKAGLNQLLEPGVGLGPVLFELFRRDGQTMGALADQAFLPRSTLTGVVRRLTAKRLVVTRSDPEDGRVKRAFLTPEALRIGPVLESITGRIDDTLLVGFTEEEAVLFSRLLHMALEAPTGSDMDTTSKAPLSLARHGDRGGDSVHRSADEKERP